MGKEELELLELEEKREAEERRLEQEKERRVFRRDEMNQFFLQGEEEDEGEIEYGEVQFLENQDSDEDDEEEEMMLRDAHETLGGRELSI